MCRIYYTIHILRRSEFATHVNIKRHQVPNDQHMRPTPSSVVRDSHLETRVPSVSSYMHPTHWSSNSDDPCLVRPHLSCVDTWACPPLSFHSWKYDTFVCWRPYSPWAIWIHKYHRRYTSCFTETLLQSPKHISIWMTSIRTGQREVP
jgi:hypothetical protein